MLSRDPSAAELTKGTTDFNGYSTVIKNLLNSQEFKNSQIQYYQSYFGMAGQKDGIDYDEPAMLAAYLVSGDLDFREILTATYCVKLDPVNGFVKSPCSTFPNPADNLTQGAGVLTTQSFLKTTSGPFNLHRYNVAFEYFACRNYLQEPDVRDLGLPVEQISGSIKTFNCNNGASCNPVCFSCHKNLNSRASVFYKYDQFGFYKQTPTQVVVDNPDGTQTVTTYPVAVNDLGGASTVADLLNAGATPKYFGAPISSVRDLAVNFANNADFRDCLARRLSNQVLGRKTSDPLLPQMQDIRDHVDVNGYRVKEILLEIAGHPAFVMGYQ